MADKRKLAQIDVPAIVGASGDDVRDENAVRRYVSRMGDQTLPGDIELDVTEYADGAWLVVVWEDPNKGGEAPQPARAGR